MPQPNEPTPRLTTTVVKTTDLTMGPKECTLTFSVRSTNGGGPAFSFEAHEASSGHGDGYTPANSVRGHLSATDARALARLLIDAGYGPNEAENPVATR